MINCSLGDDGVPSYEETCSFTCNTGYELTGDNITICQSDGIWSHSDAMCIIGINYNVDICAIIIIVIQVLVYCLIC